MKFVLHDFYRIGVQAIHIIRNGIAVMELAPRELDELKAAIAAYEEEEEEEE